MRCRESRDRITALVARQEEGTDDASLRDHLDQCRSCREHAAAAGLLNRLLQFGRRDDPSGQIPLEVQRQRVEARARQKQVRPQRGAPAWRRLPNLALTNRPVLRTVAAATTVVVIALMIIPFTVYRTVGYDLNLDGVSRELMHDDELICELLTGLGLVEAGVDRCGCDTTCCLSILDLKSEQEAVLVVGAIARLSQDTLTTKITPIRAKASRSLLQHAGEILRRGSS